MLSQSIKHSDPLKVGHFGIGFKSVFHLTGNQQRPRIWLFDMNLGTRYRLTLDLVILYTTLKSKNTSKYTCSDTLNLKPPAPLYPLLDFKARYKIIYIINTVLLLLLHVCTMARENWRSYSSIETLSVTYRLHWLQCICCWFMYVYFCIFTVIYLGRYTRIYVHKFVNYQKSWNVSGFLLCFVVIS